MLFNTPEFIFLFLPLAVTLHFTLARWSTDAAVVGTTISSIVFYAWWNPPFVVLPIVSIAANFWWARRMLAAGPGASRRLLAIGIALNIAVLAYFKYTEFLLGIIQNRTFATANVPLALSFTTFVQIAFLVYVHQRRPALSLKHYALFVTFFPHLIAGPIVRWSSFGRQLADPERYRLDWNNVALGLTIFIFGLAKKVLVADSLAPHVTSVFDAAARGEPLTAIAAWGGTLAFALQIFFDFSGYSEMAIGLGLLFNYRLPVNFAAPLRSTSMSDLWRRWHITLSRFLRDFIYVPLGRGDESLRNRSFYLFITMLVGGLWHGANWTFLIWGAIHGIGLVINMLWRAAMGPGKPTLVRRLVGWFLTFTLFVGSSVFFRAPDVGTAMHMLTAMVGLGGAPVSETYSALDASLIHNGYASDLFVRTWFGSTWSMVASLWTLGALGLVLFVRDTMEIVDYREGDAHSNWRRPAGLILSPTSPVMLAIVFVLFVAVFARIGRVSEFLYYQF